MDEIKKGSIAVCSAGFVGLVTSDNMILTKMGHMAWCGVHLSPEKAGELWSSRKPILVCNNIKELIDHQR